MQSHTQKEARGPWVDFRRREGEKGRVQSVLISPEKAERTMKSGSNKHTNSALLKGWVYRWVAVQLIHR